MTPIRDARLCRQRSFTQREDLTTSTRAVTCVQGTCFTARLHTPHWYFHLSLSLPVAMCPSFRSHIPLPQLMGFPHLH